MKKKIAIVLSVASTLVLSSALLTFISLNRHNSYEKVADDTTTFTLDENNAVQGATWSSLDVTYGEYTTIHYDDANSIGSHHIQLGANGKMYKKEASYGLESVTVVTSGTTGLFKFETDYVDTFDGPAKYEVWQAVGNTVTFNVVGNYWKLSNVSGGSTSINIKSISYSYKCTNPASLPEQSSASVKGFRTENGAAFTLQKLDGKHYLTIRGTQQNGFLSPKELFFYTDGNVGMECEYIRYRQNNGFEAFFNVDDYYANHTGTFYAHLNVRGSAWNGGDGNVGLTQDLYLSETYNIAGKYVAIREASWGIGGDTKYHHLHLEEIPTLITSATLSLEEGVPYMTLTGICDGDHTVTADVQTIDNGWKLTTFNASTTSTNNQFTIKCDLSEITGANLVNSAYSIHYQLDHGSNIDTFYYHELELNSIVYGEHTYKLERQSHWNSERLVFVVA